MHALTTTLVFGGRYAEGYTLANDLEQAQGRVFAAVRRIVECSPHLARGQAQRQSDRVPGDRRDHHRYCFRLRRRCWRNPTISCFDELWGYISERSRRLWDEMMPVPTRKISCRLVTTYAGFEGESELLEELYKRGLAQPQHRARSVTLATGC